MIVELIFDIIKYLLPALVLFFTVRLIVNAYLANEEKKRALSKQGSVNQATLPLRLQAYERLILLLERITPAQIINRTIQTGLTVYHLQKNMVQVIREEYEHNLTQQIYISPEGWAMIKTAKEEIILLINKSAAEKDAEAVAGELATTILERWAQQDQNPVQEAIDKLKSEVSELL